MSREEFVPCPRGGCNLYATLTLREDDALLHSLCPEGHDIALSPAVLQHLRSLTSGAAYFDRCGQPDPERLDP